MIYVADRLGTMHDVSIATIKRFDTTEDTLLSHGTRSCR